VDDQNGLIVHGDVNSINNERGQFGAQMKAAQEVLEKPCRSGCGDSGYNSIQDLAQEDLRHIDIIVPSPRQVSKKVVGPFDKSRFVYDPEADGYRCPEGNLLVFGGYEKSRNRKKYMAGKICLKCRHFG
jgi:transposase